MKFNSDMFKRWSTWINIIEGVGAVLAQFLLDLPEEMTTAMWLYITIRIVMGAAQGIKQSIKVAK